MGLVTMEEDAQSPLASRTGLCNHGWARKVYQRQMTEHEPSGPGRAWAECGVCLNRVSHSGTRRALLMDELLVYPVKKNLVHGKGSPWSIEEVFRGAGVAFRAQACVWHRVSTLQRPLVSGCGFWKLVASLAFLRRGAMSGGPGWPADPGREGSLGKRWLFTQSPNSQLPKGGTCLLLSKAPVFLLVFSHPLFHLFDRHKFVYLFLKKSYSLRD